MTSMITSPCKPHHQARWVYMTNSRYRLSCVDARSESRSTWRCWPTRRCRSLWRLRRSAFGDTTSRACMQTIGATMSMSIRTGVSWYFCEGMLLGLWATCSLSAGRDGPRMSRRPARTACRHRHHVGSSASPISPAACGAHLGVREGGVPSRRRELRRRRDNLQLPRSGAQRSQARGSNAKAHTRTSCPLVAGREGTAA